MDSSNTKVPLPSASESDQQTILEKQTVAKAPHQVSNNDRNVEKINFAEEEVDTLSVHSESDNEGVNSVIESIDVADKVINKTVDDLDDQKKLLETDIDKIDEEIIEILREKSIENDATVKTMSDDATRENIEVITIEDDCETVKNDTKIIEGKNEAVKINEKLHDENVEQQLTEQVHKEEIKTENQESSKEEKPKETLIDEDLLPKGAIESFIAAENNKPPVPIQTYLWEDVKRAKEQGGYPWTHLYKRPLGDDEEPEVILTYECSPKSGRRSQPDTPKSQKKVQIQEEVEVHEDSFELPETAEIEENESEQNKDSESTNENKAADFEDGKKSPKSILKRSQKLLENIKPNTSKFDSDSLKRKIKTPLQKIKKMADNQISKVKTKSSIKKIPIGKDQIVLNEKIEILKLKESPKSQHREFPAFIVKQDSDDTIDIVDLEQSPSENRKHRLIESGILTPDEIIDLPVSTDNNPQETDSCKITKECHEPKQKGHEENTSNISNQKSQKEMSPTAVKIHNKRKEHIYEEIDDIVAKIAFDSEHVDRVSCQEARDLSKLTRQDNITDPMFDEFSRELNKKIRSSLSSQDDSIRHELMRKVPKIEELEKQISDEDKEEKIDQSNVDTKSPHLLAPISSIDSTSSDEDRRAQLSILAEESETSDSLKKKSFDEPSVDIHDIESLKIDDSDVSTLIDDVKIEDFNEIRLNENKNEETAEKVYGELQNVASEPPKEASDSHDLIEKSHDIVNETHEIKIETPQEQNVKEDIDLKDTIESPEPIKINPKWSKMSDHEYEPIGEPMVSDENGAIDESQMKRKSEDPLEQGNEKKLLRSPSDESEDNISAQDFQDQIESRFFRKEIEPISDSEDHKHQEITLEEAVIIDEEPVTREIPKKKSFMESAQNSGKNFQKKIKAQASSLKSSINNKMKKKPKEKPVAVEVAPVEKDEEPQENVEQMYEEKENVESITVNVQEAEEEASKSKKSKMSNFTKNLKKPQMPKFKKPHFKKPELPKMPDLKVNEKIQNLRKLGRSRSMKESSAGDSTSLNTPETVSAEPTNKKKFDFGTYPRLIRDKFKRPKLPERSDASMISNSPAPDEDFPKISQSQFAQRGPVASRWPEYIEEESGKYQHFDSETDLDKDQPDIQDIERHLMTDEQRQLDDMDRENLQIHLMAKQEKFRKPYVERQESDIASEDDKLMWSGMLNKNVKDEEEFEQNALRYDDDYKFRLDAYDNQELVRSSTPQTNQETQSSGSSGVRRRGGFLDEDEEYFMRDQRVVSKSPSGVGEYVDSAIQEGLSRPDENALVQIGSFDEGEGDDRHELSPEKPTRSLKRKKKNLPDEEIKTKNEPIAFDYYKTYPPHRPSRRDKKSVSLEPEEELIYEQEMVDDTSEILDENEMGTFKGIEHPDLAYIQDDFENELDYKVNSKMPVPPTPPRRRKKKIRGIPPQGYLSLRNEHISQKAAPIEKLEGIVYREEHKFIPLAQEEHFTTPTPTPRRTRSRSQISSYTLDDAESFKKDSVDGFAVVNVFGSNNKENDYAIIKKEIPSRPVRRNRSVKSCGDKQFATLPLMPRRSDQDMTPPRPPRNYCTIGPEKPDKPPRRKSASNLVEITKTIKDDDYEEILDQKAQNRLSQRLQSGDIVNKMKDRPLPPPPRPKRESKKPKKDTADDDKFDNDEGGAEMIVEPLQIDVDTVDKGIEPTDSLLATSVPQEIDVNINLSQGEPLKYEDDDRWVGREEKFLPRQESDFSEQERPLEVEVSTQTDPLPYDEFTMDDEDADIEEFMGSDGKIKTLEDILKEEQEAEIERARQLAEAENLARGIQRFRESSQRSLSEHTRTSRSLSRPITPSAVVVERKKSSPIVFEKQEQIMTEAGLFIHPITYDDFGVPPAADEPQNVEQQPAVQESQPEILDVNNNLEAEENIENLAAASPEPDIDEIIRQAQLKYGKDDSVDEELDAEMQRKIEEMIESVMNTAREEAEWIKSSKENIQEDPVQMEVVEELFVKINKNDKKPKIQPEEIETDKPPMPPPRRKSNIDESILKREYSDEVDEVPEPQQSTIEPALITEPVAPEEPSTINKEPSIDIEIQASPDLQQLEPQDTIKPNNNLMELTRTSSDDRPTSPFPSRLHLSSLEIDSLSVSQLQAGRITASEIDSHSIVTNEFESKSTNLPGQTVQIELPPGLIDEIVERVRTVERAEIQELLAEQHRIVEEQRIAIEEQRIALEEHKHAHEEPKVIAEERKQGEEEPKQSSAYNQPNITSGQPKTEEQPAAESKTLAQEEQAPPQRPPLPEQYIQPSSQVLQSFYQLKEFSEDDSKSAHHVTHHRRRKYAPKKKDSTSDDDYPKDQRPRSRAGATNDQSVASLGGQFLRACGNSLIDSGNQLMEILRASSKDENNRDLHVALIILIVIVAGLFLMGRGEKSIHHHHWDFFNPPENQGR